jgi:hypothetical protein
MNFFCRQTILIIVLSFCFIDLHAQSDGLPRGCNLGYVRYEAEQGVLANGATILPPTYGQTKLQFEASDRSCVSLAQTGSSVSWTVHEVSDGLTLRFSIPDNTSGTGQSGTLALYINGTKVQEITVSSKWAWQYFNIGVIEPTKVATNDPSAGTDARMRFDEVHVKLATALNPDDVIRLQRDASDMVYTIDFIELEKIPDVIPQPAGYLNPTVAPYTAKADDNTDDYDAFATCLAAAKAQGKGIYVPPGKYLIKNRLILSDNLVFQGAGMWYTQIIFTTVASGQSGLYADGNASHIKLSDLYLGTDNNFRTADYRGLGNGWGTGSTVNNIWVEHFECGAWIANYMTTKVTDSLVITNSRFRNNYADGCNFAKGTRNSSLINCSLRNNGDDAMASWSSGDGPAMCTGNTFANCSAENTWRASGIGFFGGGAMKAHHCIVKDGTESGLRLNTDFAPCYWYSTDPSQYIEFSEITVIGCGTNKNLWWNRNGAIDIYTKGATIQNVKFTNIDLLNSQKDAIFLYTDGGAQYPVSNFTFTNINIDGAGVDNNVNQNPDPAVTWDDYLGNGLHTDKQLQGKVCLNNVTMKNCAGGNVVQETGSPLDLSPCTPVTITGVTVSPNSLTLGEGKTFMLNASVQPYGVPVTSVLWESSATVVATVDANGKVTAIVPGTADIIVTSVAGSFSDTCAVTVTPAVGISVSPSVIHETGGSATFTISTSSIAQSTTISYILGGTASAADYTPVLFGSVVLSPIQKSAAFTVTGVADDLLEGPETLTVTLQSGTGYEVGVARAGVVILDDNIPPCSGPVISYTSTAPVIDDAIDAAWDKCPITSIDKTVIGTPPGAYFGKWRAMYDAANLYVLVEVGDSTKRNDGGADWYNDDAVELLLDGDNNKGGAYDGKNDFQLGFRWNDTTVHTGQNSVQNITGIVFKMYATTVGYNLEASIPWTTIGVQPAIGNKLGFDVAVDGDESGTRSYQVTTFSNSDAWSTTAHFGSVYITTCEKTALKAALNRKGAFVENGIFSVPTRNLISINSGGFGKNGPVNYEIVDPRGRVKLKGTLTANAAGEIHNRFQVSGICGAGIFLIKLFDKEKVVQGRIILN